MLGASQPIRADAAPQPLRPRVGLERAPVEGNAFDAHLRAHGVARLERESVRTLQVNVGKRCNLACHHCHVGAGPKRTESMSRETVDRVLELLAASRSIETLDLTGGAPEMHPEFRRLVAEARRLGRRVIDRCNLTVLLEPGFAGLAEFLAEQRVQVIASLPCYQPANVERQRGRGVFERSIEALRSLNALGYGKGWSDLTLDLVYNPVGAFLPPPQAVLEAKYREALGRSYGVTFDHLLTLTNMPIERFATALAKQTDLERYRDLLLEHFNAETVPALMCRSLVSVGWDGRIFDCDFNQMLEIGCAEEPDGTARTLWSIDSFDDLARRPIATGPHCFGCTAGSGSSCSGSLR